jgi:hypothetical protein
MALRPPKDFAPHRERASPSEAELRALWERHEANRLERQRAAQWRRALEGMRRDGQGQLRPAPGVGDPPTSLRGAFGPDARAALRPVPRRGRVAAAGVDTWSPCWYAGSGSPLARSIEALATEPAHRARLLPKPIAGHRVGWFPEPRLVFAEGRAGGERLLAAAELPVALERLRRALADLGIPLTAVPCAGLRRLDLAADLRTDSTAEGLVLLECLSAASLGPGRVCSYRGERRPQSVLIKSRAGRTLARVYDKGAQTGAVPPGRWLRFEAQWRFPRGARPSPERLDAALLRERFAGRFAPLWQAAGGFRVGGAEAVGERVGEAVRAGQLSPSRARSLVGYLVLTAAGVPQGARRTAYELERECRQLGLSLSLLEASERVDVATVLDECLSSEVWR